MLDGFFCLLGVAFLVRSLLYMVEGGGGGVNILPFGESGARTTGGQLMRFT